MCAAQGETVECGPLSLTFNEASGQWLGLTLKGRELLVGGPADTAVEAEGQAWPGPGEWAAAAPEVERTNEGWLVRVARQAGDWSVVMGYGVTRRPLTIRRSATVTWKGEGPVKVYGVSLRMPGVSLGDDAVWCLPGNFPFEEHPITEAAEGKSTRERGWTWSDTGVSYAYSEASRLGIVAAYEMGLDHAWAWVDEGAGRASLRHRFDTLGIFQPGEEVEVGTQWLRIAEGGRDALRKAADELTASVNHGPPEDRPEWLDGAVLDELHPWGRLEAWHGGDRGNRMPSIEAQLPYLKGLGVDGIWLLPVSMKPPWVYQLPEFRRIDPDVTSPEDLRAFIAATHRLGMHTLMDLVTYGVSPSSPDIETLPKHVWAVKEDGERQKAWGDSVLCADLTEPDWTEHIVDLTTWWVRSFGADGYRLDCGGWGQVPNWKPRKGGRANATMQSGGIRQNAVMRAAIREVNPDAVLMPEAGLTAAWRSSDMLFDYPFYMVCREITRDADTARWVRRTREWLAGQQLTHSRRQRLGLVRFLENHDTVAAQDFWGIGPSQALTALCAFVPGVLLLHQEQEVGFAPELRDWLKLRHELPELRTGEADYENVTASDPNVLAFIRRAGHRASVVAINFGPDDTQCALRWPQGFSECEGALTGIRRKNGEAIPIPAYRPVVLTLRHRPRMTGRPLPAALAEEPLVTETKQDDLEGGLVRRTLKFAPVKGWFVRTSEGMLRDEFIDRHRSHNENETHVDATVPLWRCWRPLKQGYWDGPGEASLGVIAADGRAAEVRLTALDLLTDVRILDDSAVGESVRIIIEGRPQEKTHEVIEYPDGQARLAELRARPAPEGGRGTLTVEPLWVRVKNKHYEAAFSRRHGGTLFGLRKPGGESLLADPSEVYTDWGLFEKGLHVATEWETTPRLSTRWGDQHQEVTFIGHLRRPAWNGVHAGHVIEPNIAVRLTYRFDESPVLGVTFGITPSSERPDTNAFLAYRFPFASIDAWEAAGPGKTAAGEPGEKSGERVFQTAGMAALGDVTMTLKHADGSLGIRSFSGDPAPPQNPLLLDGGDAMHLFVAMLNGEPVTLPAGEERTTSFEIVME